MADQKVTQLTANTDPQGTDIVYMVDDPGGTPASRKITVANLMTKAPYALLAGSVGDNPADATTYYLGGFPGIAMSTTSALRRLYIPKTGIITSVYLVFVRTAGSVTTETSTISVRLNNTSDTTISSAVNLGAASIFTVNNTALSIAVTAGDYIELKWVTPTWTTNPTGVNISAIVLIS